MRSKVHQICSTNPRVQTFNGFGFGYEYNRFRVTWYFETNTPSTKNKSIQIERKIKNEKRGFFVIHFFRRGAQYIVH